MYDNESSKSVYYYAIIQLTWCMAQSTKFSVCARHSLTQIYHCLQQMTTNALSTKPRRGLSKLVGSFTSYIAVLAGTKRKWFHRDCQFTGKEIE